MAHKLSKSALVGVVRAGRGVVRAAQGVHTARTFAKRAQHLLPSRRRRERAAEIEKEMRKKNMKKSGLIAILALLAAIAGALAAVYVYLQRREKELDEYEKLLFGDEYDADYSDEDAEEAEDENAQAEEPKAAE